MGFTTIRLAPATEAELGEALQVAWRHAQPKKRVRSRT